MGVSLRDSLPERERERKQREEKWANRSLTLTVLSTEFSWWPLMKYGSCRGGAHTDRPTDGWEDTHTHTPEDSYTKTMMDMSSIEKQSWMAEHCPDSLNTLHSVHFPFAFYSEFFFWSGIDKKNNKKKPTFPSNWMCELCSNKWQQIVYLMQMNGNENPFSTCFSESIMQLPFWYKHKSPLALSMNIFSIFTAMLKTQ